MREGNKAKLNVWNRKISRRMIIPGIFLLISLVFFYSFIYNDILETMRVGINFWTDLFAGNVKYFYAGRWEMTPFAYTKEVQAVYDFPIYIVFAIWNFPLWIAENFFGVDIFNSVPCLMWGKTLLLVAVVLITRSLYRLCLTLELKEDMAKLVCILFLSSNFFMTSIIMMCAYDIIALYFAVEGINYYFKENNKGFLICFMLAIPLKFFALLLFVPLVLLKEKRIPYIIGYVFMSILPILFFRIILPCEALYGQPDTVAFSLLNMFKSTNLSNLAFLYAVMYEQPAALSRMFPSIFCWVVLFLLCYFVKIESKEKMYRWGIYVCFMAYAILFVTCMSHPYWLLIMTPFMMILIGQNSRYLYINLVLETALTWGMILAQIFKFPWCFGNAIVAGMFVPGILGRQDEFNPITPMTVFTKVTGSDSAQGYLIGAGTSVFIAGILIFSVLNIPGIKKELPFIKVDDKPAVWLINLRILAGFVIAIIPVVLHVAGVWI